VDELKKKLGPAVFIETAPAKELTEDRRQKSFILKLDTLSFDCSEEIEFKDIKEQLIDMAKRYIDNAPLMTAAEYDQAMYERYKTYKLPLVD